jgi:hypothetical protein
VSLRKAYQSMIKAIGLPDMAMLMEMSESSLDNRVYERKDQQFTVRQALRMQDISKSTFFAEAVAVESGGTFVKLPDMDHIDNDSLLAKFNELYAEIGQLSAEFAEATKDGEIDDREQARLDAEGADVCRTVQELLVLSYRVYRRDGKAGTPK